MSSTTEHPRTRAGRTRRRAILTSAVSVVAVLGAGVIHATPASATFDGNNGRIAFRRFLNVEQTWGAVFTIRPDGRQERQITQPPQGFVDRNPDVSPDGRRIAFEREGVDCGPDCGFVEVFVVDVDGTNLTQLTRNPPGVICGTDGGFCNGSPAWSPDGKRIAFTRSSGPIVDDDIENVGISVMNADGTHIGKITQPARPGTADDSDPQWSPDGRKIVFQRRNVRGSVPTDGIALWIVNLRTGDEHQVTPWELRAGDTPDWSPDGRQILFHDNVDPPPGASANLYTIRPDGTHLHQLTFAGGGTIQHLGSSFSPDGTKITFGRKPATGGTAADVFVMNADGSHVRAVTRTDLYDSYPDWGRKPHHHDR